GLLVLILEFPLRADGNVGMNLESGKRIADGKLLYVDYDEINPPTIHYINALPALISRLLSINALTLYLLLIWLLIGLVCLAVLLIIRCSITSPLGLFIVPFVIAVQSVFLWAITMYGEREHIIFLTFVPWFLLRWQRYNDGQNKDVIHPCLAVSIGFLA